MYTERRFKLFKLLFLTVLMVMMVFFSLYVDEKSCMGISLITERELEQFVEELRINMEDLRFNDEKIATDIKDGIIYIAQSQEKVNHASQLEGVLKSLNPEHALYFLENDALINLEDSVHRGHMLTLIVVYGNSMQRIPVVITTLPVLRLEGEVIGENEKGREIYKGNVILSAGHDPLTKDYSLKKSDVEWNVRGSSTAEMGKKSWKLSLKKKNGENQNLEFLGMGEDDDWILNGMSLDDTRIKEKFFMDVWNQIEKEAEYNYKMSTAEYVEVVVNGDYRGIYLLQRRIDDKYLELKEGDVLLKAGGYGRDTVEKAYKIESKDVDESKVYSFMKPIFTNIDGSSINVKNLIDINIMLMLVNAKDNFNMLNMYYVLKDQGDKYEVFLVPWDTDQSMGVIYDSGFKYNYERSVTEGGARCETGIVMLANPRYSAMQSDRWEYLRKNILTEENLHEVINNMENMLEYSGASCRDKDKWELVYEGEDTVQNLKKYISERLEMLDVYYE